MKSGNRSEHWHTPAKLDRGAMALGDVGIPVRWSGSAESHNPAYPRHIHCRQNKRPGHACHICQRYACKTANYSQKMTFAHSFKRQYVLIGMLSYHIAHELQYRYAAITNITLFPGLSRLHRASLALACRESLQSCFRRLPVQDDQQASPAYHMWT